MTCLKCNKEVNPEWLCCPFHEELVMLKEKCPECGEIEEIGRPVCENEVKKIKNMLNDYMHEITFFYVSKMVKISLPIYTSTVIVGLTSFIPRLKNLALPLFLILFAIALIVFFGGSLLALKIEDTKRKQKEQEFLHLHPEYAEILKKAKGEKK